MGRLKKLYAHNARAIRAKGENKMKKITIKLKFILCYLLIGLAMILPTGITIIFANKLLDYHNKLINLKEEVKK